MAEQAKRTSAPTCPRGRPPPALAHIHPRFFLRSICFTAHTRHAASNMLQVSGASASALLLLIVPRWDREKSHARTARRVRAAAADGSIPRRVLPQGVVRAGHDRDARLPRQRAVRPLRPPGPARPGPARPGPALLRAPRLCGACLVLCAAQRRRRKTQSTEGVCSVLCVLCSVRVCACGGVRVVVVVVVVVVRACVLACLAGTWRATCASTARG